MLGVWALSARKGRSSTATDESGRRRRVRGLICNDVTPPPLARGLWRAAQDFTRLNLDSQPPSRVAPANPAVSAFLPCRSHKAVTTPRVRALAAVPRGGTSWQTLMSLRIPEGMPAAAVTSLRRGTFRKCVMVRRAHRTKECDKPIAPSRALFARAVRVQGFCTQEGISPRYSLWS